MHANHYKYLEWHVQIICVQYKTVQYAMNYMIYTYIFVLSNFVFFFVHVGLEGFNISFSSSISCINCFITTGYTEIVKSIHIDCCI